MNKTVTNLRVGIGIDPRDLQKGAARVRRTLRGLANVAKVAGIAAGGAFTAASLGMAHMARQGLQAVDAQGKMARSIDGTVDGLRALQIAGGDAGVATEQIGGAMQRMGAMLGKAAREGIGPAHDALEMLGLSADELIGMDVDQRLAAIADKAKEFGLSAQQTSDILTQLGIRNKEMALLVMQGGDAIRAARQEVQDFGLALDQDMVESVERANDALARIGFVAEGFRNQLAVAVAPALEEAALRFKELLATGGPLQSAIFQLSQAFGDLILKLSDPAFLEVAVNIGTTLLNAVKGAADVLVVLADNAEVAGAAMVALGAAMAFFSGPIGLAIAAVAGGIGVLATQMGTAQDATDELTIAEHDLSVAIAAVDMKNRDAVASGEAKIRTRIDEARATIAAAQAELELARSKQKAGNALLARNPLTANEPSGYAEHMAANTAAAEAELKRREEHMARLQKMFEGFQRSKFPSQGIGRGDGSVPNRPEVSPENPGLTLQSELETLIKTLDPAVAKASQMAQALDVLKRAKAAGTISQEEYNLRVDQLNDKLADVPAIAGSAAAGLSKIKEELDASGQIQEDFASGVDSAMKGLINNMDQGMSAVKAFGLEVIKLLTIRGISMLLGGSSWFDGPLFSPIGKNALGTDHWRGGLTWVGERGPEIVNLPAGAKVIPNHRIDQMGAASGFTYAPVIDARGADAGRLAQLEQTLAIEAKQLPGKVLGILHKANQSRRT